MIGDESKPKPRIWLVGSASMAGEAVLEIEHTSGFGDVGAKFRVAFDMADLAQTFEDFEAGVNTQTGEALTAEEIEAGEVVSVLAIVSKVKR